LIVLDDAGQYDDQQGDGWRLVSTRRRFATLGQKRNAAADLIADDTEAVAVWDDDDLYLPWALSASAAALEKADWSRPSVVLHPKPRAGAVELHQHETGGLFHGGWAFTRQIFQRAGGYPAIDNGEDQALARRLRRVGARVADPIRLGIRPFYIYPWGNADGWHLSGMGRDGYRRLGGLRSEPTMLEIADPPGLDLSCPRIVPGVRPRVF